MSYEPRIFIKFEELSKFEATLENIKWGVITDEHTRGGEDNKTALEYIADVYFRSETWEIFGIKCKFCHPQLTSFNRSVRAALDELGIKYSLIN